MCPQKPESLKQNPQGPLDPDRKIHWNTKVNIERPESAFKLPFAKFDTVPSTSNTKSTIRINEQCNALRTTKSLQVSYSFESMDTETDSVVASLNLEDIINIYNTWNLYVKR